MKKNVKGILALMMCVMVLLSACSSSSDTARIDAQFSIGSKTDTAYSNRFFEIAFTLPDEDWMFLSDEQIALVASAVQEQMTDSSAVKSALDEGNSYFDVIAINQTNSNQINVVITKADASLENISAEMMLDSALSQLGAQMEAMGATNVSGERTTTSFRGETVPCVEMSYTLNGFAVYAKEVVLLKGSYAATVTVSTYGADATQELLELITTN